MGSICEYEPGFLVSDPHRCSCTSLDFLTSRSLPAKLSPSYLHGFLSVQHAVSLPPSEAFRKLFARCPIRPACCLAPSQRSFPQAICTVSSPSSMLSRSLPPSEALPKLFARFPVRPACCLAPSQRSFPQSICTVSSPSSMLSRSLPAKLPQAISMVSCRPSSMLSRSLPAKLSASYFHGFLSVQHPVSLPPSEAPPSYFHGFLSIQRAVSLPPSEALPKLFPRFFPPNAFMAPPGRSTRSIACCKLDFMG